MNSPAIDPRTPVLVGCGQITDNESPPSSARSPSAFVAEAARLALADAQAAAGAEALAARLETIAVLRFFSDSSPRFVQPHGRSSNPPKTVARFLGAGAVREFVYTELGGNMPQYLRQPDRRAHLARRARRGA